MYILIQILSLTTTYKNTSRDTASRVSKSPFLRAHSPKRCLSKLLILLLLLLAPITFSSDNIPNFQPECETSSTIGIKTVSVLANFHKECSIVYPELSSSPPPQPTPHPLHIPPIAFVAIVTSPRAPPA